MPDLYADCTCPECTSDPNCPCGQIDPRCPVHGHWVWRPVVSPTEAQFRQEREGNWTVPKPPDPLPTVPVRGEDYSPGCGQPNCPCERAAVPCKEWMGHDGDGNPDPRWCPRCGWAFRYHPKESIGA